MTAAQHAVASRESQGLAPTVVDPAALARIAAVLAESETPRGGRGASKASGGDRRHVQVYR